MKKIAINSVLVFLWMGAGPLWANKGVNTLEPLIPPIAPQNPEAITLAPLPANLPKFSAVYVKKPHHSSELRVVQQDPEIPGGPQTVDYDALNQELSKTCSAHPPKFAGGILGAIQKMAALFFGGVKLLEW